MKKQYLMPATQEQGVLMNAQILEVASPAGKIYIPTGSDIQGSEDDPIMG